MASQRRMFSRRSVVGFLLGILVGFNIASWFAIPAPSRTDIAIQLIGREDLTEFRVQAAQVRHGNRVRSMKTGKDCDEEIYGKSKPGRPEDERRDPVKSFERKIERKHFDEEEEGARTFDDFDLEEERHQREQYQENNYDGDLELPQGQISQQERLEDFRPVPKAQKYNYDSYPKEESDQKEKPDKIKLQKIDPQRNRPVAGDLARPVKVKDRNHFLYVGVLTAQKYLSTRGRAIMDTWGQKVSGKIEFYVGEGVKNVDEDPLPLVKLITVKDDVYPPQKKSFLLLKHMHDSYLNSGYQWFVRADDDVYIKTSKLETFLRQLNSSEPIFLGQTGLGNSEERGRLSLNHGENYCMGGPGMIFSRELIRRVGPHIRKCVKHLYSWHEDVELSRCVREFAGINCAWSYQMQELFYEHYFLRRGYIDPSVDPSNPKLHSALTLHPNKNPAYQVKLHTFIQSRKIYEKLTRIKFLSRDVVDANGFLGMTPSVEEYKLGLHPTLHRYVPKKREEVIPWEFMNERLLFAQPPDQARRAIPHHRHVALRHIIMQVMRMMNSNARARGRIIDFKQIAYGYRRVNPVYGVEYVLDLLLVYKRYRGKKMTIPVRRHAYLQRTFTRTEFWEDNPLDVAALENLVKNSRQGVINKIVSSLSERSRNLFNLFGFSRSSSQEVEKDSVDLFEKPNKLRKLRFDSGHFTTYPENGENSGVPIVNIIVPLVGRLATFRKFMANLARVSLSRGDPISLLVIMFKQTDPKLKQESQTTIEILQEYSEKYPLYDLRHIVISGKFSRGLGLEIGASHFSNDSLLFFCDVDVVYSAEFTRKCRANSELGKKVYYPILHSEFHPEFNSAFDAWSRSGKNNSKQSALSSLQNDEMIRESQSSMDHFDLTKTEGYWRSYGFGLLCVFQHDFISSGGFDINIRGWGLEDVDLVDKFVGSSKKSSAKASSSLNSDPPHKKQPLQIFRTSDPSLVHVYHPSHCSPDLAENQMRMCKASRASGITSISNLAAAWQRNSSRRAPVLHPMEIRDPVSDIAPLDPEVITKVDRKTAQREVAEEMLHLDPNKKFIQRGKRQQDLRHKKLDSDENKGNVR